MPERWERELKKWGGVHAPPGMRARVEEGPTGDGAPPIPGRGQRVLAGVVAFAVFGAAAWIATGGFGSDRPPPLGTPDVAVLRLEAGANDPDASLTFDGAVAGASVDSYCWNQANGASQCVDIEASGTFSDEAFLPVPRGTEFAVENPQDGEYATSLAPGDDPTLESLPTALEDLSTLEAGRYVLTVAVTWEGRGGTIRFHFALEITAAAPSPPADAGVLLATLDAPADGSPPGMTLTYEGRQQEYFGGGRWLGEDVLIRSILMSFEPHLPPGTAFRVAGDASEVHATTTAAYPDGRWEADASVIDLASGQARLPADPGTYRLEVTGRWPQGRIGFSVVVTVGDPSESQPSPLPDVEIGVVPDLVGVGEGDATKLLARAGFDAVVTYEPVAGVAAGFVVSSDPEAGTLLDPGSVVALRVSGTDVPLDGYLAFLACSSEDMMPFAHEGDGYLLPAPPFYIIANLVGFQPDDELTRIRSDEGEPGAGIWEVRRGGDVIAVIHAPSLDGIACRGSGIGGV